MKSSFFAIFAVHFASMNGMKRIFTGFLLVAAVLVGSASCIKMDFNWYGKADIDCDANLAAAYFLGSDENKEYDFYELRLIAGKAAEDFELDGAGRLLSIQISVPFAEEIAFPEGRYFVESESSYVEMRSVFDSDIVDSFKVENGVVSANKETVIDGGVKREYYDISVELIADGRKFEFEYEGELITYDTTLNTAK